MGCTDCTKAYQLIELPVGSSKDAVKSARKEWSKNLHPDIWQSRPGWKGAANQLTNTALPFVISTGAQRSGEISVLMLFLGNVFRESEAQWRDLRFLFRVLTRAL
jgi:hypothetical protein